MQIKNLSRSRKVKLLSKFLAGETTLLQQFRQRKGQYYSLWSDEELEAEYERLRQKEYREPGIMPPPLCLPNYSAMSDQELEQHYAELMQKQDEAQPETCPTN